MTAGMTTLCVASQCDVCSRSKGGETPLYHAAPRDGESGGFDCCLGCVVKHGLAKVAKESDGADLASRIKAKTILYPKPPPKAKVTAPEHTGTAEHVGPDRWVSATITAVQTLGASDEAADGAGGEKPGVKITAKFAASSADVSFLESISADGLMDRQPVRHRASRRCSSHMKTEHAETVHVYRSRTRPACAWWPTTTEGTATLARDR